MGVGPGHKVVCPTIPSKYLTPVIDVSDVKTASNEPETVKISKLVDDPTRVGPGSYENSIQKSPKSTINWIHSRSQRSNFGHNLST